MPNTTFGLSVPKANGQSRDKGMSCRYDQRAALMPKPSTSYSTSWAIPRMVRQRRRPGSRPGSTTRPARPTWPTPKAISTASSPSISVRSSNATAPGPESQPWSSRIEHADEVSAPDLSRPLNPSPPAMDASGWKSLAETDGQTRTSSTSAADTPTKQENRPASYGTYPPPTTTKINSCQKVD